MSHLFTNSGSSTRMRVGLFVAVMHVMVFCECVVAQRPAFNSDQVSELLKSNRVADLRRAHAVLKAHPNESVPFIASVAKRANHPELTETLRMLAARASGRQLRALIDDTSTQQVHILKDEWGERETRYRASTLAQVAESPVANAAAGDVATQPPVVEMVRPAAVPKAEPKVINRSVTISSSSKIQSQMTLRAGPGNVIPRNPVPINRGPNVEPAPNGQPAKDGNVDLSKYRERLASINRETMRRPPNADELKILFEVLDQDLSGQYQPYFGIATMSLHRHAKSIRNELIERWMQKGLRYPSRLTSMVMSSGPADDAVVSHLWRLTASSDKPTATGAIRALGRVDKDHESVALRLLDRPSEDSAIRSSIDWALSRLALKATPPTRSRILIRLLDAMSNHEATPDRARYYRSSPLIWNVTLITRSIPSHQQADWLERIRLRMDDAKCPAFFVRLVLTMDCDLRSVTPTVRRLLQECTSPNGRALYASFLLRVENDTRVSYPIIHQVLQAEVSWDQVEDVMDAMSDTHFPEFASDLCAVMQQKKMVHYRYQLAQKFGKIGAAAKPVVPCLLKLLEAISAERTLHYEATIVSALGEIGAGATEAVPDLMRIAKDDSSVARLRNRIAAIDALAKIGSGAKNALPVLRELVNSKHRQLAQAATKAISKIQ